MCLASVQKYSWFLHIDFISYNLAFLCEGSLGISLYKDHSFTPSFPSWILFISLSSLIAPARTSSTMLKKSNESDLLASFLILEVKTYCLWLLSMRLLLCFSIVLLWIHFTKLQKFISIPIFLVKVTQSCPTLCDPMDYTVHGILQAIIPEWVAFPLSRGSSQPRDWIQVSRIAGKFFNSWATREDQEYCSG